MCAATINLNWRRVVNAIGPRLLGLDAMIWVLWAVAMWAQWPWHNLLLPMTVVAMRLIVMEMLRRDRPFARLQMLIYCVLMCGLMYYPARMESEMIRWPLCRLYDAAMLLLGDYPTIHTNLSGLGISPVWYYCWHLWIVATPMLYAILRSLPCGRCASLSRFSKKYFIFTGVATALAVCYHIMKMPHMLPAFWVWLIAIFFITFIFSFTARCRRD